MKKILLLAATVFAVFFASAQDQKAKEILDEVSRKAAEYSTIEATFSYSMVNEDEGIDDGYSGTISLKGNKYYVYIADIPMLMVSDGNTIWSYMEDVNEVTISSVKDQTSELLDPARIFTIYEHGFNYKFTGEATENGKPVYKIDLIPETEEFDFTKISISIDKNTMIIASAIMLDDMGTQYKIEVKKAEVNTPVDDSKFTFDVSKYDDIEVIDFR
ncbi:MAG: outer membrane lipoprotein carrier protein LolA [Prolixibacteraceae bacterium]|nr:outer membrane lipoprotein carrier protein LolA [Prolixibacteraceae bacterium]MBN2775890.1 outer membrane lipoprotein carrier protein LolA [Prolixibacteraceae bacterium]